MLEHKSIHGKLAALLLAFVALVSVSVGATYWGISTHRQDALTINLAGRQRMLIQLMTRLAEGYQNGRDQGVSDDLIQAADNFEQTLAALQYGGPAPYSQGTTVTVPPAGGAEIQNQLGQLRQSWAPFRAALDLIGTLPAGDARLGAAVQTIEELSPQLVAQADSVVQRYETESTQKVVRLRNLQIGFFISALLLLWAGVRMVKKSLLGPLDQLGGRARQIGAGDLETAPGAGYPREIDLLDQAFDQMQIQLRESRAELIQWGKTLEVRVDQRTRALEALHEISRNINSRLEVEFVLASVTEKAKTLLGAQVAALCFLGEGEHSLEIKAHRGPEEALIAARSSARNGLADKILAGGQVRLCQPGDCDAACQVLASQYRASHIVAPLWAGEQQVIGALCVGSTEADAFDAEALPLLAKLAGSAAIAIENARLYAQAERSAALEERGRIAADMHDRLGQTISKIGLNIDRAGAFVERGQIQASREQLQSARQSVDLASQDVRGAIAHLLDDTPLHQSLQRQIEALVREFQSQAVNGNRLHWHNDIAGPIELSKKARQQVLRVAGEALNNVCHHANATNTDIHLQQAEGDYLLIVADDGEGFDPRERSEEGRHFGLKIMRARAAHLGGDLEIDSAPGAGTRLTLRWPVSGSPGRAAR